MENEFKERTYEEIVEYARALVGNDFLGTKLSDLIQCLPYEMAKEFLTDACDEAKWGEPLPKTRAALIERIREYLTFAWDKANGQRGLSASRSIDHMSAWLWLLGFDISEKLSRYSHYGKPQLRAISEAVNFDWKTIDDGLWSNGGRYDHGGPSMEAADLGLPKLV